MKSAGFSCEISMKLGIPRQIFEKKNSSIKFHENPSSGGGVFPRGQTDLTTDGEIERERE